MASHQQFADRRIECRHDLANPLLDHADRATGPGAWASMNVALHYWAVLYRSPVERDAQYRADHAA